MNSPEINRSRYRLGAEEYHAAQFKKDLIMLHFTASSTASSVCHAWRGKVGGQIQRVATAYVVDTDGTIYEFFPPECWAWHLGMTEMNPGSINDKRSIGIEIVNPGPLRPDKTNPAQLNWWPSNFGVKYCTTAEKEKYVEAPFRGEKRFAAFPQVQSLAVQALVKKIASDFSIPTTLPPVDKRTVYDPRYFSQFRGIASHQNFRADKVDIGPAFDWRWVES